jgi:hypothetical protein
MHCLTSVATLPLEKVQRIEQLEKELGVVLVAYNKPASFSNLSEADLAKVRSLEKQLGVKLVALD